jgi:prolipoprotein diacylglyceryl transferase
MIANYSLSFIQHSTFNIQHSLFITWNVNPEIFNSGSFAVRWYGLLFACSFLFGYYLISKFLQKENLPLHLRDVLLTYMFIGVVVGARLGHCIFYEPAFYLSNPLEIFKIWEGGLASHGGALGILICLYIFARKNKMSFLWILDRMVIIVALGGAFIRTGNLVNSEIIGKATDVPWAFVFTRVDNIPRHPAQIYEAVCYLAIFASLMFYYYKKQGKPKEGIIFGWFLISLFTVRFLIEFLKEVQVDFEHSLPLDLGQMLSVPFIIAGISVLIRANAGKMKSP